MQAHAPVSVAIPVFNGEATIKSAIASVLAQTYTPTEVRVFDNASTDHTRALAAELLPAEAVVESPTNRGAVHNFNRAAAAATQPYFMWLAADDRIAPEFVARTLALLEQHPAAPACLTGVRFVDDAGMPLYMQADPELSSPKPRVRLGSFLRRRRWTEFYCMYRTEALRRSPMAQPVHGSDVLLTWWFLLRGPLAVTSDPLLVYTVAAPRKMDALTEAITPGAQTQHWLKARMWMALWRATRDSDLPRAVRWSGRLQLLLLPTSVAWWFHFAEDVTLRWPLLRRAVGFFVGLPTTARPRRLRN